MEEADRFERMQHVPLPYVTGERDDLDGMDVYVRQSHLGKPYAEVHFVAGGCSTSIILGFGPEELKELGRFLFETGKELKREFGKPEDL